MRSPLILLALCASALALAGPARSDTITLKPDVHMLGQWVDGMVLDGKSIWVAETGQSSLAQLTANYGVARRVKLGGIPDKIDIGRDGALYLLLQIEDAVKLWQQFPGHPPGKAIAALDAKSCPSELAAGGGAFVWVLGGCNGDNNGALLKVDIKTGASAKVPFGAGSGGSLMVRQGEVWVGFDKLSVIDEATLAVRTSDIDSKLGPQSFFSAFAAGPDVVYAGIGSDTAKLVVAIDPATLRETARATVDQTINTIVADAQNVVAFGADGRIFVLSAGRLELQRVINLTLPNVEPRKAMIRNGDLLFTDFRVKNETGALLVLHGWRPAAAAKP
jgi:hypothetical protein